MLDQVSNLQKEAEAFVISDESALEARETLDAEQKASSLTAITSLQDADQFIVADSSDSNNSKKITFVNMQGTTIW